VGRAIDQEVDDFVQAARLRVFVEQGGAMATWDPARGLDRHAFVAMLAAHAVDEILRSRKRNPWSEEATDAPALAAAVDESDPRRAGVETLASARRMALAVAARMKERTSPLGFSIFEMLFLHQRTTAHVAAAIGLGVPAVYTWKSRLLREALEVVAEIQRERGSSGSARRARRSARCPPSRGNGSREG